MRICSLCNHNRLYTSNYVWYELSSRVLKPFRMSDLHFRWPKNKMEDYHWDYVRTYYLQWGHEHDPHYK
jgi:hypothetical protein